MIEGLTFDRDDDVLVATLDRGTDNRLSSDICRALTEVLDTPDGVHVLHVRAVGDAFCLGRDRAAEDPTTLRSEVRALIDLNVALRRSPVVSVAEIQGDAAGFGVGLAALCDVSVAARSVRVWFPEVEIDLAPTVVLSWLPRRIGELRAFHLAATGEQIGADDAVSMGLITLAVDDVELATRTKAEVERLRGFKPWVHQQIKEFLGAAGDLTETQAYDLATERLILGSMTRRRG